MVCSEGNGKNFNQGAIFKGLGKVKGRQMAEETSWGCPWPGAVPTPRHEAARSHSCEQNPEDLPVGQGCLARAVVSLHEGDKGNQSCTQATPASLSSRLLSPASDSHWLNPPGSQKEREAVHVTQRCQGPGAQSRVE